MPPLDIIKDRIIHCGLCEGEWDWCCGFFPKSPRNLVIIVVVESVSSAELVIGTIHSVLLAPETTVLPTLHPKMWSGGPGSFQDFIWRAWTVGALDALQSVLHPLETGEGGLWTPVGLS